MFAVALFLSACTNSDNKTESANTTHESAMHSAPQENKFADVQFASDKDPVCQMPLSAGIADTAVIDDNIYGFCAIECKETYVKENRK